MQGNALLGYIARVPKAGIGTEELLIAMDLVTITKNVALFKLPISAVIR